MKPRSDHAPVLALSGDMPRKLRGIDYIQSTEPDLLFRDVSLYTETVSSPAQAPRVVHQAIAAAYAGRGVAHLTLPQNVIAAAAEGSVPSVVTLKPPSERVASDDDIDEIADRIDLADHVLIMCAAGCHGAVDELRALSDRLEAPLIHSVKGKDLMPYDDPHWMGGIGMIGSRAAYDGVMNCDLLLMVGTDYPSSEFLPDMTVVVQVDERPQALGRRTETALGVVGSARPTLQTSPRSGPKQRAAGDFGIASTREQRKWDDMLDRQADLGRSTDRIHPQAVARIVGDLAERSAGLRPGHRPQHALVGQLDKAERIAADSRLLQQRCGRNSAGSSQRRPGAGPNTTVIALCGDGGFNMLMGEFLTAAQHELPVKVVIYNNSCFGLIPLEAEAAGLPRFRGASNSPMRILSEFASRLRRTRIRGREAERASETRSAKRSPRGTGDRRCGHRRRRDAEHAASRPLPNWALRAGQGQGGRSRRDRGLQFKARFAQRIGQSARRTWAALRASSYGQRDRDRRAPGDVRAPAAWFRSPGAALLREPQLIPE